MALDHVRHQVLVIFRAPADLAVFSMTDGKSISSTESCGDADDLFVDAKRDRVYISCGAGFLDVLEPKGAAYRRTARVPTASGARPSPLFPQLDPLPVSPPPP